SHNASVELMNPVLGYSVASQSAIKNFAIAHVAIDAKAAPISTATTPSAKKGNWNIVYDAPTRRIMPDSRRLENADNLIVVAINKIAVINMITASAIAMTDAMFMSENNDSKSSR